MFDIIPCILTAVMMWLYYVSGKYRNPYKLRMYFGKKGCGKTTHICKTAFKYIEKGIPVYTTEYIPGTYHIDYEDIGTVHFPRGCAIFIDEVGMIWDNRQFKSFSNQVRDYFKLQRHYGNTVYLYSQCFDIDKKLRDLCDELYIMKSYFNCISVCKRIKKDLTIVEAHGEAESRITDDLKVMPFFLPGARKFTYLPKYHQYFDSFAAPELKHKEYPLQPIKISMCRRHLKPQLGLLKLSIRDWLAGYQTRLLTYLYREAIILSLPEFLRKPLYPAARCEACRSVPRKKTRA